MTNDQKDQKVNPFHIQGYIRDERLFYGRQTELTEIWGYLRKGFNVSIVAPRLVGKSSLLWFIKEKAAAHLTPLPSESPQPGPAPLPKIETFYFDMQVIPTAEAFWQRLAEALVFYVPGQFFLQSRMTGHRNRNKKRKGLDIFSTGYYK